MRIFISYSSPDINTISVLADQLKIYGDIYYWEKENPPGEMAWEKIYNWIDNADIVLVLVTDNTIARSPSVTREIERSKLQNKIIIPMVAGSIPREGLSFLSDLRYQEIDIDNPEIGISHLIKLIEDKNNVDSKKISLILVAVAFFLWLLNKK